MTQNARYSSIVIGVTAAGLLAAAGTAKADIVWSGLTYSFTVVGGSDWTLPENQDRITSDVWITRGGIRGIFNIHDEPAYQGRDMAGPSPVGTEWAFGTTADYSTLSYTTWAIAAGGSPGHLVGQPMVMHLINSNIYLDIMFTGWNGPNFDGSAGFSYIRAVPTPGAAALLGLGGLAMSRRRR